MQQAATLETQVGDILIVAVEYGKAGKNRVPMMTVVVDRIEPVGTIQPLLAS